MHHFGTFSNRLGSRVVASVTPSLAPGNDFPFVLCQDEGERERRSQDRDRMEVRLLGELIVDLWDFAGGAIDMAHHTPHCTLGPHEDQPFGEGQMMLFNESFANK